MDLCGRVWPPAHAARVLQATHALCAGEGSFTDLPADATAFVAADCPPADLAIAIERAAGRRLSPDRHRTILADRSPEAFAARLAPLVA